MKSKKCVKIGFGVSVVASILGALGLYFMFARETIGLSGTLMTIASVGAIASYIMCGGFSRALKAAFKLGKFGWLIIPFPYDIITGFATFLFALQAFFVLPVFFVFKSFQVAMNGNEYETDYDNEI